MKSATDRLRDSAGVKQKSAYTLQLEQELADTEQLITFIYTSLERLREFEVTGTAAENRPHVIAALVKAQEEAHKLHIELRQTLKTFTTKY